MEILMSSLNHQIPIRGCLRALICILALCCFSAAASAQTPAVPSVTPPDSSTSKSDKPEFGSSESEARAKLILKEEKKRYDEHLGRAREVSQLAAQLSESYKAKQAFDAEDNKRLERLEKLTKRIRNEAGGSEADLDVKKAPPDMPSAVKRVTELAEDLRKLVEKTPRHVISAAVIDQANELIGIIQYVRDQMR